MADYYPLLSRAVANLSESTPETRGAIYDRARAALTTQLRSADPPVSEDIIDAELASLSDAVSRIEAEAAGPTAQRPPQAPETPAPNAGPTLQGASAPQAPVQPPRPRAPIITPPPPRAPITPQPAPSEMPAGAADGEASPARTAPDLARPVKPPLQPPPMDARSATDAESLPPDWAPGKPEQARATTPPPVPPLPPSSRAGPTGAAPGSPTGSPTGSPGYPVSAGPSAAQAGARAGTPQDAGRPAAPVGATRPRGRRRLVVAGSLAVFALAAGIIGFLSWSWRAPPDTFVAGAVQRPSPQTPSAPGGAPEPASPPQTARDTTPPPPSAEPEIAVAQRAALLVQAPTPDNARAVQTYVGTVVWSAPSVNRGAGEPLTFTVRADINIPDAGLRAEVTMEKNTDAALPASHTLTWRFQRSEDSPISPISDIGSLQMRDENSQGTEPLASAQARITSDIYIIALAAPETLAETNIDTMRKRGWFDLPLRLENGNLAQITMEKGRSGQRILTQAFDIWEKN